MDSNIIDKEKQEYYYKKGFMDGFIAGKNQSLEIMIKLHNRVKELEGIKA